MINGQTLAWMGGFGKRYTDRNALTLAEMEGIHQRRYGFTRMELNREVLGNMDRSMTILEVGANIGNQLLCLKRMGFTRLCGVELQRYALCIARSRTRNIPLVQADGFQLPFQDDAFDMLLTSGFLIHIHPSKFKEIASEIYRCAREYIWGLEYYADERTEILYRERQSLLWKADYSKLYQGLFNGLEVVQEKRLPYLLGNNEDTMFLLRKT